MDAAPEDVEGLIVVATAHTVEVLNDATRLDRRGGARRSDGGAAHQGIGRGWSPRRRRWGSGAG